jgi:hypothetical protein
MEIGFDHQRHVITSPNDVTVNKPLPLSPTAPLREALPVQVSTLNGIAIMW